MNRYLCGMIQSGSWCLFTDAAKINTGLFPHFCSTIYLNIIKFSYDFYLCFSSLNMTTFLVASVCKIFYFEVRYVLLMCS